MKILLTILSIPILSVGMLLAELPGNYTEIVLSIYVGFLYLIPFGLFYDKREKLKPQIPELIAMNFPVILWYLLLRYWSDNAGVGNLFFEAGAFLTLFIILSFIYFLVRKFATSKYTLYCSKPYIYMTVFVIVTRLFMPEIGK